MLRVLLACSEAWPLIKTGGLADVAGSLPPALAELGIDVRLLLPAYPGALAAAGEGGVETVAELTLAGLPVRLLQTRLPGTPVVVWLLDYPPMFARPGDPYLQPDGRPWWDNEHRFALLARAAVAVAGNCAGLAWQPQVLHCHDWQTGLAPALLDGAGERPATVFTIHNLAYQGLFPSSALAALELPAALYSPQGLEFHGQLSFIKGGIAYADRVTTVSPRYALEIQTPGPGCGLEGLLSHRAAQLSGILNGIDTRLWNPATDPHLAQPYDSSDLAGKGADKAALLARLGLPPGDGLPLLGFVGRLVEQKGVDWLLALIPQLGERVRWVILGNGEARYERALGELARRYPQRIALHLGYDEALSHQIQAGADIFLMPSRFEPCGLTQLYSLRYGTVPVVHAVGGLADTVIDDAGKHAEGDKGNGFCFHRPATEAFRAALERALAAYRDPARWRALQRRGMARDSAWQRSAQAYAELYRAAALERGWRL